MEPRSRDCRICYPKEGPIANLTIHLPGHRCSSCSGRVIVRPTSMRKITARDVALVVVSASMAGALALSVRLPARPDMNNMLGLIGSLIGAAVAVIAGLIVIARQFETSDERQLRTILALLIKLREAGDDMSQPDAAKDPARYVKNAHTVFHSAQSVASQMQANGPAIAIVAQLMSTSDTATQLQRLIGAGQGIASPDLHQRGEELKTLADDLAERLRAGL